MKDAIWTFKTARFVITLDCDWETSPDFSWDETGETEEKCRSGEWDCVCFRVRVTLDGDEVAADYLGNSIYANVRDFRSEHVGSRGKWGAYFPDMVRTACAEARAEVKRRTETAPRVRIAA